MWDSEASYDAEEVGPEQEPWGSSGCQRKAAFIPDGKEANSDVHLFVRSFFMNRLFIAI